MVRLYATITLLTYATVAGFATFVGQSDVERVTMSGSHFRLDAISEQRYTSAPTPHDKAACNACPSLALHRRRATRSCART
jgi:hypothetical protein